MVFCGQLLGAAGPNRRRCKKVSITQPAVPLTKTAHRSQDTSLLHRREVEESGFAPVAPNRPVARAHIFCDCQSNYRASSLTVKIQDALLHS